MDFLKNIHIGKLIHQEWKDQDLSLERTCKFFKCNEAQMNEMFLQDTLETKDLLLWSKLLKYDFFRLYSQHLLLYSGRRLKNSNKALQKKKSSMPAFRKNIYTVELIYFILDLIDKKEKTKEQVIEEYGIPKTTLYKWLTKYKDDQRKL